MRAQHQDDNLAELRRTLASHQYPTLPHAVQARIERALRAEAASRPPRGRPNEWDQRIDQMPEADWVDVRAEVPAGTGRRAW